MSNRFYVNDVQIFGNNEMFQKTHDFIISQGGNWTEDYWILEKTEIKDPQGLMDAVTEDSLTYLKENLTIDKKFEELTDFDLIVGKFFDKDLLIRLYRGDGSIRINHKYGFQIYKKLEDWIEIKRFMTPYGLWLAIKDCVNENKDPSRDVGLTLKEGKKIIVEMH